MVFKNAMLQVVAVRASKQVHDREHWQLEDWYRDMPQRNL
jgi:hypothetical protein